MMQKCRPWLLVSACTVCFSACFSFKISPLPLPENYTESFEICRKVEIRDDLLSPIETSTVFGPTEDVFCYVRLRNVRRKIQLRWKWYAPDRNLARDTGNVDINADEKYLDTVTAGDPFRSSLSEKKEGYWLVCIMINDVLASVKKFVIQKDRSLSKALILLPGSFWLGKAAAGP
jgi:hypothetical protein